MGERIGSRTVTRRRVVTRPHVCLDQNGVECLAFWMNGDNLPLGEDQFQGVQSIRVSTFDPMDCEERPRFTHAKHQRFLILNKSSFTGPWVEVSEFV